MKVTIYAKPGCGPCAATQHAMESRGIAHEVIDVMDDDAAKGQGFSELVILGTLPSGERWVSGNCNAGASLILMERAKLEMIGGGE